MSASIGRFKSVEETNTNFYLTASAKSAEKHLDNVIKCYLSNENQVKSVWKLVITLADVSRFKAENSVTKPNRTYRFQLISVQNFPGKEDFESLFVYNLFSAFHGIFRQFDAVLDWGCF